MTQIAAFPNQEEIPRAETAWAWTLVTILVCHVMVDFYAAVMAPILGIVEFRHQLSAHQAAWLLGMGSVASGLAQPIAALFGDRLRTRALGTFGIILAALGIGSIGWVGSRWGLWCVYIAGMIGIGMFHPAAASAVGQLRKHRRSSAVGMFFVAGMSGGVAGSFLIPRIASVTSGLAFLPWIILPGALLAIFFHRVIRTIPDGPKASTTGPPQNTTTRDQWTIVALVYVATFVRFTAQLALVYLFVRWVQGDLRVLHADWTLEQVTAAAAPRVGNLNAFLMAGSALGGLCAGMLVRSGREKWPLVWVPFVFAPMAAMFPYVPLVWGNLLGFAVGISSMSMVPIAVSLAQRMLPHRTHLASGIMIGGAWVPAMFGPQLAELGLEHLGQRTTFHLVAVVIAASGLLSLPLRSSVLRGD